MSNQRGVLNYTTTISPDRTLAEMQAMLGRAGARRVVVEYQDGTPAGLAFSLMTPHGERGYTLPCDHEAMLALLRQQGDQGIINPSNVRGPKGARDFGTPDHAERVAWRVLKDWLEAQLALVATQMVQLDQVMLPYLHVEGELTMYEAWREHEGRELTSG